MDFARNIGAKYDPCVPSSGCFEVDLSQLKSVLDEDELKDRNFVAVFIAGAMLRGKRFLLNCFLKYFYDEQCKSNDIIEWMVNAASERYHWQSEQNHKNVELWMWPDTLASKCLLRTSIGNTHCLHLEKTITQRNGFVCDRPEFVHYASKFWQGVRILYKVMVGIMDSIPANKCLNFCTAARDKESAAKSPYSADVFLSIHELFRTPATKMFQKNIKLDGEDSQDLMMVSKRNFDLLVEEITRSWE